MPKQSRLKPLNARQPPAPAEPVHIWYTVNQLPPIATREPGAQGEPPVPARSIDVLLLCNVVNALGEIGVSVMTAYYWFPANQWRYIGRGTLAASGFTITPCYWSELPPLPETSTAPSVPAADPITIDT